MKRIGSSLTEDGITLIELMISLAVLAIIMVSMFSLYTSLIHGMFTAKTKAVATTLATNQMEYLKGLSYDSLAVAGGSIYATNPLPASSTKTLDNITYKVSTSINYVDDAYDGCTSYPTQALKEKYCRNYPPPTGAPSVDTNAGDYKVIHVTVKNNRTNETLSEVDSQVAARVAETSSTTGALLVTVLDENGNPLSGATVGVTNTTITPNANLSDSADSNGVAIFYGLPPDTGNDYTITASKTGYSTLSTIKPSGSLQPVYPSQNIVTQQSSSVTMTLKHQGANSLVIEAVNTAGAPISGLKVYVKGGYKKYTLSTDTSYYFDNSSPDTRPTTDASGNATLNNLAPGDYYICGDTGATSCAVGGTTYYMVAALPYGGSSAFSPTNIPIYDAANPPATTFSYGGNNYLQKVRLVLTTSSNHPRIVKLTPSTLDISSTTLTSFAFQVTGANLPTSSVIRLQQGSNTYTATCTGSTGALRDCTVNLSTITTGFLQLIVTANSQTFTAPGAPPYGGINVVP